MKDYKYDTKPGQQPDKKPGQGYPGQGQGGKTGEKTPHGGGGTKTTYDYNKK